MASLKVYCGSYRIDGNRIHFQDQHAYRVAGAFRDGVLLWPTGLPRPKVRSFIRREKKP